MRILYYDCFSGISGDMNLGAMVDLGVDKDYLINELSKLNLEGYEITVEKDMRKGITGTKVNVILQEQALEHSHEADIEKEHYHGEEHGHHHHHDEQEIHNHEEEEHHHFHHEEGLEAHEHNHLHKETVEGNYETIHEHHHRNLNDIVDIIEASTLSDEVKKLSIEIFMKVAEAEAKVHGKSLYEVHFHEVGAVDSIVDIVGAAICINFLKIDKIICSSVELGGGFVKCAHGKIPVPAPAVTEILKGVPVKMGAVPFETTTPTGAAILTALVDEFSEKKEFTIYKTGYGIGNRDTEIPNVLRIFLGEAKESDKKILTEDSHCILECNIDDMNPEMYDYIMDIIFEAGASDVFLTPIIMKKGRPATKLTVLCNEMFEESIKFMILRETTTLGVRKYKVEKTMLEREISVIETSYGKVRIKASYLNGEKIKVKPEYDDCKKIAKEHKIPLSWVYEDLKKHI